VTRILGYNAWLFGNALDAVDEANSTHRVDDNTNPFGRLAGHVTVSRHGLAGLLGIEVPELPWGSFGDFAMGKQFEPDAECPPLGEIQDMFKQVTEALMAKLPDVSDGALAAPSPFPIPGENPTMGDLLAFLTMHETYHIGQMGLLKKSMSGKPIMDA
jgi:uncharacterized damage-inducible protein DinB